MPRGVGQVKGRDVSKKRLWQISESPFQPERLRHFETLFAVGNGYLSTRGAFDDPYAGATPTTLVHGIFNLAAGQTVPELVNTPNWLPLQISIDGTPFSMRANARDCLKPKGGAVLGYRRTLDLQTAVLQRQILFRAESGSIVRLRFERFASLANPHLLAQRLTVEAVDGAPFIQISAGLDADIRNHDACHWRDIQTHAAGGVVALGATTTQSAYEIALASHLTSPGQVQAASGDKSAALKSEFQLDAGDCATFDKLTAIFNSRDVPDPLAAAMCMAREATAMPYAARYREHRERWAETWSRCDLEIEGDDRAQFAIRFAIYHLLIAAPRHDDDVSIGAKTLSGLGYKGHVFWDTELFVLPLLTLTQPGIARNLLTYRYKRLSGARQKAREYGYAGALFPWESTDTGLETTPKWSDPDPAGERIRIWTGETEQHINSDIAYAVLQYWRWSGDDAFMCDMGAEIVLDTAVFWGERAERTNGRYEISRQIGPDEYHENIDNSVFTNRLVQWHLSQALGLLSWLEAESPATAQRLSQALDLSGTRLDSWRDTIANMHIPFDEERGVHEQFDGFFDLEYIPVSKYQPRVGGIWGLMGHERVLGSQVIKQADVVMLMALLGDEVGSREVMLNNFNTYYPRTDHGSSLSPAIHAWVAARLGLADIACEMFERAAAIDLEDRQGNVADGIHAASCGGLWQAIVFGFCGLRLTEDGPAVDPKLPAHWRRVSFSVTYRGQAHRFDVVNPSV